VLVDPPRAGLDEVCVWVRACVLACARRCVCVGACVSWACVHVYITYTHPKKKLHRSRCAPCRRMHTSSISAAVRTNRHACMGGVLRGVVMCVCVFVCVCLCVFARE